MSTRTRYEKEAKGNSEMAYFFLVTNKASSSFGVISSLPSLSFLRKERLLHFRDLTDRYDEMSLFSLEKKKRKKKKEKKMGEFIVHLFSSLKSGSTRCWRAHYGWPCGTTTRLDTMISWVKWCFLWTHTRNLDSAGMIQHRTGIHFTKG